MKRQWPELVGKTFAEAESVIRTDRPDVHIVHVTPGVPMSRDLDFSRVFVITSAENPYIVEVAPGCG